VEAGAERRRAGRRGPGRAAGAARALGRSAAQPREHRTGPQPQLTRIVTGSYMGVP